jgi:para-aminobenzoate synthetase / 4-amino-4-deoxychorismate lyase
VHKSLRSTRVQVIRRPLDWALAPERAALLVRDDAHPFALIGDWAGGGALIGSEPTGVAGHDEDPFAVIDEQPVIDQPNEHPNAVGGGWFGYLGYDLGRRLEPVAASPPSPATPLRPFALAFYDHLVRLDSDGQWWFEALWSADRAHALEDRLTTLERRAASPAASTARPFATEPWSSTPTSGGHERAVEACVRRIHAGDLFQANICLRLESRIHGDALDLFAAAAAKLKPARAAYLAGPWGAAASLSPELFLARHGSRVRSAPIKGTRPATQRRELEASVKDHAENVMIVDLVRNDLGRVCTPGSITVDALARARLHTGVWHLVSEVSGTLAGDTRDGELVRAAFPPGSVTGAPKVAALNVISELESTPRDIYTGAIGFASPVHGLELNVAIRTFEFRGRRAWLGVGGGIVADSDPHAEAAEAMTKARPLLAAIGSKPATSPPGPAPRAPIPARLAPKPVPRPDPAAGVFETILIADGEPVALEHHLARLERSTRKLYRRALPETQAAELVLAARGIKRARLRINARPDPAHGRITIDFELTTLKPRTTPVRLTPVTLPGGLGRHKWIDRRLLDALTSAAGGYEPLLCDLDGYVLETARASIFAVDAHGVLTTPPADGRILPGVTRLRVLELAAASAIKASVRPLHLSEVRAAEELFVTGALGGIEQATLEARTPAGDRFTSRLNSDWTNLYKSTVPLILS